MTLLVGCAVPANPPRRPERPQNRRLGGWGIDAVLTRHVEDAARPAYLELLRQSAIATVREREPDPAMEQLRSSGFAVVAFTKLPDVPQASRFHQPEDLLAVFYAARRMQLNNPAVDAWEIACEADVGYIRDLPERFTAFHKAVYLGIKSANPEAVALMGALALPPGPWLERATRNGLLEYTDAYNFHFYGNATDLAGVIGAHRSFVARAFRPARANGASVLPFWITEAGMNAASPGDWFNPDRRRRQAWFTLSTARQALAAPDVAMFMPFILVNASDPSHSLVADANRTLPAWEAYAKFTQQHPWPERELTRPPVGPNPVVMQWVANAAVEARKVGGTYVLPSHGLLGGEVRIYNFSDRTVRGRIERTGLRDLSADLQAEEEIVLDPMSVTKVSLTFQLHAGRGYVREEWNAAFVDEAGRRSPLGFGVESWPTDAAFQFTALPVDAYPALRRPQGYEPEDRLRRGRNWWTSDNLRVEELPSERTTRLRVVANRVTKDPMEQTVAAAHLAGLPKTGFLRVRLSRPMDRDLMLRVDLVDRKGQRFTIWENFGVNYGRRSDEAWLSFEDFHNFFWGRTTEDPRFHPEDIREIQLRFTFAKVGDPVDVELSVTTELSQ